MDEHMMAHPTCEICKHASPSMNQSRPWMRNCAINNCEWHKDDYCSNHSEPIPEEGNQMDEHMMAAEIAALKNEIETLKGMVKDERAKVVQEVREWAEKVAEGMISSNLTSDWDNGFHRCYGMLKSKLFDMSIYSMEDKTNV